MTTLRKDLPKWPAIVACLSLCASIFAQEQAPQKQSAPAAQINLIVTDRSNHSVDDLRPDQVQLFEDKIQQKISQFSKDERPVDYALVIDCSGSFRKLLPAAVEAARMIINNNRPEDETFIQRFISADKIEMITEFTSEKARLMMGMASLYVEGGQSAVLDAVYLGAKHVAEHRPEPNRRRALVLFTDGEDRSSYYSENQLFEFLKAGDVQIFVIGITFQLDESRFSGPAPRQRAEKLLKRLAQDTGGRTFFPKNANELSQIAGEVAHDLHAQYLVTYESTNPGPNNFRTVEVKISDSPGRDKLTAITRPGYFINPPDSSGKEKDKKKKSQE